MDEEMMMEDGQCKKCHGRTEGYKCDLCGATAEEHDPEHSCGGEHCMPKCMGCQEAEELCTCA